MIMSEPEARGPGEHEEVHREVCAPSKDSKCALSAFVSGGACPGTWPRRRFRPASHAGRSAGSRAKPRPFRRGRIAGRVPAPSRSAVASSVNRHSAESAPNFIQGGARLVRMRAMMGQPGTELLSLGITELGCRRGQPFEFLEKGSFVHGLKLRLAGR